MRLLDTVTVALLCLYLFWQPKYYLTCLCTIGLYKEDLLFDVVIMKVKRIKMILSFKSREKKVESKKWWQPIYASYAAMPSRRLMNYEWWTHLLYNTCYIQYLSTFWALEILNYTQVTLSPIIIRFYNLISFVIKHKLKDYWCIFSIVFTKIWNNLIFKKFLDFRILNNFI